MDNNSIATPIDFQILETINRLRQDPSSFIPHVVDILKSFSDKWVMVRNKVNIRTNEGTPAVQECLEYLQHAKPLGPMTWEENLAKASRDHTLDTGPLGNTGHNGSDGSTPSQRIKKYVTETLSTSGENISYGESTALDVVMSLIIDDGVESRGHRKNIFNPDFVKYGSYTGYHKLYNTMTCMNFGGAPIGAGSSHSSSGQASSSEKEVLEAFMKEEVEFEQPEGTVSISKQIAGEMSEKEIIKTVTCTFKLRDGSTKTVVKTVKKAL